MWASFFLVIFLVGLVNGAGVEVYRDLKYNYQVYRADSITHTNIGTPLTQGVSTYVYSPPSGISQHWRAFVSTTVGGNSGYGRVFSAPEDEDYVLLKSLMSFNPADYSSYLGGIYKANSDFRKYRRSGYYLGVYKHYELPAGDTCHATYVSEHFNSATKKLTVTVDNDLNPLQTVNGIPIKYNSVDLHEAASLPPALNQILRKNYYTKYFVYLKLSTTSPTRYKDLYVLPQQLEKNSTGKIKVYGYPSFFPSIPPALDTFKSELDDPDNLTNGDYLYYDGQEYPSWFGFPYFNSFADKLYFDNKFDLPSTVYLGSIGFMYDYPYVILKPGQNDLTFDLTPVYNSLKNAGLFDTWTAKIYLIPVDGKCDLNGDGYIVSSEATVNTPALPFQIVGSGLIPDLVDTGTKIVGVDAMHRPGHCHWDKLSHKIEYSDGTPLSLPTPTHNITLVKKSNGVLISKDTVPLSSVLIALRSANLRNFKNATSASKFINQTVNIMDSLNVQQTANYIPTKHQTNVKINITTIPAEYQHNLTLYIVLPKTEVTSLSQIKGVSDPNKFFYVDGDPIIGWNLNNTGSTATVSYNVSGSTSGGTVIITQTPILFNGNTVIINYRTGGCSPGEIELWELDSLDNSKVYAPGSGRNISVCISHPNATLYSTPHNF